MTGVGPPQRYLLYASEVYALAVLRPLQDAIRRQGAEAVWFFDGPGVSYLEPDERVLGDVCEVRAFNPAAVFVPGNRVPDFFPGAKVEVFHGFSVGKRSDGRGHFRIRGLFDLYCTQGPTTTEPFRRLAEEHGHFQVAETGWPKIDPLFREPPGPNPWTVGWESTRPIVLYASTFTPTLSSAAHLREPIRRLAQSGRFNWLVTLHPKMGPDAVESYRELAGPHLRYAETDDVIPLLQAADAMVSDTSSIVVEFLLQHKPVVTVRNTRPGSHLVDIHDPSGLAAAVETVLARPDALIREIAAFADRVHPYRDGASSERVLEATRDFLAHPGAGLRPKPLNLWRRLQVRRRLGYYRWR